MNGDLVAMSGRKVAIPPDTLVKRRQVFGPTPKRMTEKRVEKKRNVKKSPTVIDDVCHCVDHAEYTDEPADHFMEVDVAIEW